MPLATIENVTATVGDGSHNVTLIIDVDGLVVGAFGKLPWAGAEVTALVADDGCVIDVGSAGVHTRYLIPASSFAAFGGPRAMTTFSQLLLRSAVAAGARLVQPVA